MLSRVLDSAFPSQQGWVSQERPEASEQEWAALLGRAWLLQSDWQLVLSLLEAKQRASLSLRMRVLSNNKERSPTRQGQGELMGTKAFQGQCLLLYGIVCPGCTHVLVQTVGLLAGELAAVSGSECFRQELVDATSTS